MMASPPSSSVDKEEIKKSWLDTILSFYPDIFSRTHCVPPVHFNRVPYGSEQVAGKNVLVLEEPVGGLANVLPVQAPPASSSVPPPAANVPSDDIHIDEHHGDILVDEHHAKTQVHAPDDDVAASTKSSQRPDVQLSSHSLWEETTPLPDAPKVHESDIRDDFAQHHVLVNLKHLGDEQKEVMFILSQFDFADYLNQPSYSANAASVLQLPRPKDLGAQQGRGDFDILLIHRKYGILVGEIKSVGLYVNPANPQPPTDATLAKRLKKVVEQLDKSVTMIRHLFDDIAPGVLVRKTLILPYLTNSQLQRVFENNAKLGKMVCQSLGVTQTDEAMKMCLCSDQLSDRSTYWDVTPDVLSQLSAWWGHRMTCEEDMSMTNEIFLDIVARFVGPASSVSVHCVTPPRVEVRTWDQAVAELGRRLMLLVLTQDQLAVLTSNLDKVCVSGPPGTGKSVMLVLIGLRWLLEGHDVYVVSLWHASLLVSHLIRHQLLKTLEEHSPAVQAAAGQVHLLIYDIQRRGSDIDKAVNDLVSASEGRQLCVLIDEAAFAHSHKTYIGPHSQKFVKDLVAKVPNVRIWAASIPRLCIPEELHMHPLQFPLRCAPVVLREVLLGLESSGQGVHSYHHNGIPSPADGPSVIRQSHQGDGHTTKWPDQCEQCGHDLAKLFKELHVGEPSLLAPNSPPPLHYSDIFIITRSGELYDEKIEANTGKVLKAASGLVRGLRAAGVPVCITGYIGQPQQSYLAEAEDIAVARHDKVTVARWGAVSGLERKVVVWLQGWRAQTDDDATEIRVEGQDRLVTVSRCTTQLIVVDVPSEK